MVDYLEDEDKKPRKFFVPIMLDNLEMLSAYDMLRNLKYELDDLERGFGHQVWGGKWSHDLNLVKHLEFPHLDIFDENDKLRILVEIPGSSKEDIQVDLEEDNLHVHAKTRFEKRVEGSYHVQWNAKESEFEREIHLPTQVVPEEAKATYVKDVLEIEVPKIKRARKSTKVTIK